MDYKKILRDNYTIHIVNTKRFKSIDFVIYFTKKFEIKNIPFYSLLTHNMTYTTKKYNTKNKTASKSEELYESSISVSYDTVGSFEQLIIYSNFLNPKYTEDKYYYESIDLFFEVLLNPNVNNNKFNSKYFNIIKEDVITNIKATKDNPQRYAKEKFNKIMYKGTPRAYVFKPTINDINKVNEENLYSFYKKLFDGEYKIDVILLGEIDESKIDYIDKKLKGVKGSKIKNSIYCFPKYLKKVEKIDTLHFNQSRLYMGYNITKLTDFELDYVMRVYNTILGTMNNSILFSEVREKNSLCYSINSYYSKLSGSLVIYSGINKDNYEKSKELINNCINMMKDVKIINRLIKPAKKTLNTFFNSFYDDAVAQGNQKYMNEFIKQDDIETQRKIIDSVKAEQIIEVANKIELSVTYLLKGDN